MPVGEAQALQAHALEFPAGAGLGVPSAPCAARGHGAPEVGDAAQVDGRPSTRAWCADGLLVQE
eukprot:14035022-Alexandrium_andersonii.AAC.1